MERRFWRTFSSVEVLFQNVSGHVIGHLGTGSVL